MIERVKGAWSNGDTLKLVTTALAAILGATGVQFAVPTDVDAQTAMLEKQIAETRQEMMARITDCHRSRADAIEGLHKYIQEQFDNDRAVRELRLDKQFMTLPPTKTRERIEALEDGMQKYHQDWKPPHRRWGNG